MRFLICLLLAGICFNAQAADPRLNWKTLETDHFLIHYDESRRQLANSIAKKAELAHTKLSKIFDWTPAEKTQLVLSDESDIANGYVTPFPLNRSVLFLSPPDEANSLEDFDDWMDLLIEHEYTHVLHLDKAAGLPLALRSIFGRNFLLLPNSLEPNWITEGIATFMETDTHKGVGRGQSTLFNMMMRTEVMHGLKPVDQVNLPLRRWPMRTSWYLYGVYFFEFMDEVYGKDVAQKWVRAYSRHIIPFMINTNAETVFGKDLTSLWAEYEQWLQKKYASQIKALESASQNTGTALTDEGYQTNRVEASSDGGAWFIEQGGFASPHLAHIDAQGHIKNRLRVNYGARLRSNRNGDLALTQLEICDEYNVYYDIYLLKKGSQKLHRLTQCGRYRSAAWYRGNQLLAVKRVSNEDQLVLLDKKGKVQKTLWKGVREILGPFDIDDQSQQLVASVFRPGKGWNIEMFDLASLQWRAITDDRAIEMAPSFNADGDVLFSSDSSGVYNLYRYHPGSNELQQLTRVVSGAFSPSQYQRNMPLYYIGYGANGYDVYKTRSVKALAKHKIKKQQLTAGHKEPALDKLKPESDYSPWQSLRPRWWMPMVLTDKDQSIFGFETSGTDALGVHLYSLSYGYDATNQWSIGQINYSYVNRIQLGLNRYNRVLNDSTGTLALVRKKTDAYAIYNLPFTRLYQRQNILFGLLSSSAKDGQRDTGLLPLNRTTDNLAGMAYVFDNTESYIRSISQNNGRDLRLVTESSDVFDSDYSGEVYTLNWREYVGLGKQDVLAWDYVAGWGTDRPDPFQLGGETSSFDFVSLLKPGSEPVFGRRDYNLRGYQDGLPQLSGRRMQLASLEWRFPIRLVERGLMAPPVGLLQWSGTVFAETGAAWNQGSSPDKFYSSTGVELNNEVNLFYGLNVNLRLGYAKGLDKNLGEDRIYLSLGSSF